MPTKQLDNLVFFALTEIEPKTHLPSIVRLEKLFEV